MNLLKTFALFPVLFCITLFSLAQEHIRKEGRFDEILERSAEVKKLADGFQFTEGPVWNQEEGYLLFSDIPANTIYKWSPDGGKESFRSPSNNANGLTYDREGNLIMAEHSGRKISKLSPDGEYSTVVDKYKGKPFNSPNDVIVDSKGAVYFTDPPYGLDSEATDTLGFNGVYRFHKNKLTLIADDLYRPNGLVLSPDESILYVANSDRPKKYMKYPVSKGGKVGKGKLFFNVSATSGEGNPDGIKVDTEGNIYATGPGGILVFSPQGRHLGTIVFPETPANLAFGDEDMRTLYVTARTGLYSVRVKISGKQ
ncbi:SMP-30/gluconolactonase/LRE family protein [Pleomorphovibrio marinus]|uniref:SMP-30/gluconolactonase/LRE family protein n=1 Tax=Pleomorphovibrio marinus TaxID=2164132 RepID=UPI000E0AA214|nr:SMP-30/gluconolactonase/LRE family protein [Pleomorphovibrio marinus]